MIEKDLKLSQARNQEDQVHTISQMGSRNESEEVGSNMLIVPDDYIDGTDEQGDILSRKEIMAGDMGTMMESVTDYPGTLVTLSGEQNQRSNSI